MKVLLIGSGGREHALAQKISESKQLEELYILPGNPGTKQFGININLTPEDQLGVINFCTEHKVDLVVIGPEKSLTEGLSDALRGRGFNVFGPSQKAAKIEGEKSFAKHLMKEYNIPTASFEVFSKKDYDNAVTYLKQTNYPIVVKADGIAAGKGVMIAENIEDAKLAVDGCFNKSTFGTAGDTIVIEEFMTGQEASIFAITDGEKYILLPAAQDHKRIFDGDKGKNTGGMGAYAPTPFVTDEVIKFTREKIVEPTLKAMRDKQIPFIGCLYCGLMLTENGPKVVEFNCRFGDPETQVVMPLLSGDFLELLSSAAKGNINLNAVAYNGGASVSVVAASGGYPEKFEKDFEIMGLNNVASNIKIYHAGTKEVAGKILTNGGRVLNVTSFCETNDLIEAKRIAYMALSKINFNRMHFRKDISDKAIKAKS
jgi:phosphoribosylamine--glycine ligase